MNIFKSTLFAATVVAIATGCSSIESETKRWESNQTFVKKKEAEFPQYQKYFEEDIKNANVLWEQASNIQDEDQKIKAMEKANLTLSSLMSGLDSFYSKISTVNSSIEDVMKRMPDSLRTERINRTIADMETMTRQAKSRIVDGQFDTSEALKKYLRDNVKMFGEGDKILNDFYRDYQRKQEKEAEEEK